jgi:hypothetical protein
VKKSALLRKAVESVRYGDKEAAIAVARDALKGGLNPLAVIDQGFGKGMAEIAELFSKEEAPLSQVLMAAEAMNCAMRILEPSIPGEDMKPVVIDKRGIFFGRRILARMAPLSEALDLMETTRYTWPPLLWDVTRRIKNTFDCEG